MRIIKKCKKEWTYHTFIPFLLMKSPYNNQEPRWLSEALDCVKGEFLLYSTLNSR